MENGTDVCVIYLSALSVHRAEQRANIVFTHTHGFAMQIIWYYCTYSAYRRGSSVTGTASNPSFLPRHPLASSIYLRDTRALYTYRIGIGVSCYCCFFPRASIIYGKTFFRICIDEESSLDIARFASRGVPVLLVPLCLDNRRRSSKVGISLKLIFTGEIIRVEFFLLLYPEKMFRVVMKI